MRFHCAVAWSLRLAAWAVLLFAVGRLLLQPTRVWLDGRVSQMHVRLESARAATALFHDLGLHEHFDPTRYRLVTAQLPGDVTPLWLGLQDTQAADYKDDTRWIWLASDGTWLLPALANQIHPPADWKSLPEPLRLRGRNGRMLTGAICALAGYTGEREWIVWIHRDDRWVNALRFRHQIGNAGNLKPVPSWKRASALELEKLSTVRFVWDQDSEAFQLPDTLDSRVEVLEPSSDQIWQPTGDSRSSQQE